MKMRSWIMQAAAVVLLPTMVLYPRFHPSPFSLGGVRSLGRPALSPGSLCYLVRSLAALKNWCKV